MINIIYIKSSRELRSAASIVHQTPIEIEFAVVMYQRETAGHPSIIPVETAMRLKRIGAVWFPRTSPAGWRPDRRRDLQGRTEAQLTLNAIYDDNHFHPFDCWFYPSFFLFFDFILSLSLSLFLLMCVCDTAFYSFGGEGGGGGEGGRKRRNETTRRRVDSDPSGWREWRRPAHYRIIASDALWFPATNQSLLFLLYHVSRLDLQLTRGTLPWLPGNQLTLHLNFDSV